MSKNWTMHKSKDFKIVFFLVIVVLIILLGCSNKSNEKEQEDNSVTANVVSKIYKACKFDDNTFCDESCCIVDESCGNQGFGYRKCDLETGEWDNKLYFDSTCAKNCSSEEALYVSAEKPSLNCSEGWKCTDYYHRSYQAANCSLINEEYCERGCTNNLCNTICEPGALVCSTNVLRICDSDGNKWSVYKQCDYGCKDNDCLSANEVQDSNNANSSQPSSQNVCDAKCFAIANLHYDADGNDCQNLNDEYVIFENKCPYSCDLTQWTIGDASSHIFTFPSFTFHSGKTFTLYTGAGTDSEEKLYWNSKYTPCKAIWNNDKDTLYLKNSEGGQIFSYSYP